MRPGALLLAALLLAAPLAAPALAQGPRDPIPLGVVGRPTYTVGDAWSYRITTLAPDGELVSDSHTVVAEVGAFRGVPAVRLESSERDVKGPEPNDPARIVTTTWTNRTVWLGLDGHRTLSIQDRTNKTLASPAFRHTTFTTVTWEFHEPMDVWQFPIVPDDRWFIVTNVTFVRNESTHLVTFEGNETRTQDPERRNHFQQRSSAQWLREHRGVQVPAGAFDTVVVQSVSGNTTLTDYFAPAAGNIARREIVNTTGRLVQTMLLTNYTLQQAPAPPARPPPPGLDPALLVGGGVALVAVAGAALAWRMRVRGR